MSPKRFSVNSAVKPKRHYRRADNNIKPVLGEIAGGQPITGASNLALGALGTAFSPVTGAFNTLGQGVTQLTGNPDIGDRAAALSSLLLPIKGGATAAKAATTGSAINTIVDTVGAENVPALVGALKANPRLTIMDKSEPVACHGAGFDRSISATSAEYYHAKYQEPHCDCTGRD